MAGRTITQRIALEGGDDIQKQLKAIGDAGAAAFDKLNGAQAANNALASVGTSIDAIAKRASTLKAAFSESGESIAKAGEAFKSFAERATTLPGVLGLVVTAFGELYHSAGEAAEALQNSADAIGVEVEKYKEFKDAADLSGVGESFDKAMRTLISAINSANEASDKGVKSMSDLQRQYINGELSAEEYQKQLKTLGGQSNDAAAAFQKLGVSFKNADGSARDPLETFRDIADALNQLPNGVEKSALSMQFFGTRNAKFGAFAMQGSKAIDDLVESAKKVAPTLDKGTRESLDRTADSILLLGKASTTAKDRLLGLFSDDVTRIVEAITEQVTTQGTALADYAKTLQDSVKPAVDEIVALIQGKTADVQTSWITDLATAAKAAGSAIKVAFSDVIVPAVKAVIVVLGGVASAMNAAFGTNLTGQSLLILLVIGKITGSFKLLSATLGVAGTSIKTVLTTFETGQAVFGVLGNVVTKLIGSFTKTGATLTDVSTVAGKTFEAFRAGQGVVDAFSKAGGVLSAAWSAFNIVFDDVPIRIVAAVRAFGPLLAILTSWPALIIAAGVAIGALIGVIIARFGGVDGTIDAVEQALGDMVEWIGDTADSIGQMFSDVWAAITQGASDLATSVQGIFATIGQRFVSGYNASAALISGVWASIVKLASDAWTAITDGFKSAFASVGDWLKPAFDALGNFFGWALKQVQALLDAIKSVGSYFSDSSTGASSDTSSGFAGGGAVRGPGTATSDSIIARLSDGEFVQRAAAVRKYGVRFMDALNRGLIDPGVIQSAMSGLASAFTAPLIPRARYATGGAVVAPSGGSMQPVHVHFGGETFAMQAAPDAVRQITRAATRQQMRSGGRKPSWYR